MRKTERSWNLEKSLKTALIYDEKSPVRRCDILLTILLPLSLAKSAIKIKIVKVVLFVALIILNSECTCDLTNVAASIYDRKIAVQTFDTIHDILRSLSLAQSLFEGRNA